MYPIIFEFGAITVFSLWFFVAIGFVASAFVFVKLSKRYRIRLNLISDYTFFLFILTLVVSRLVFIFLHLNLYFYQFNLWKFFDLFAIWDKGLSFWGALIGLFGGILYISKRHKESPIRIMDVMIPALLIGMIFGDIGAFMDGINYGTPTKLPWAITFRNANVKYISGIHPVQFYSILYTAFIAYGLARLLKNLRGKSQGLVAEAGLFLYSFFRFFEEFFRGDDAVMVFGIRLPFIISLFAFAFAFYLIYNRIQHLPGGGNKIKIFINETIKNLLKQQQKQDFSEAVRISVISL